MKTPPGRVLDCSPNRLRDRRHLLLIPIAALFVVHPLIVNGCSCGHDFDFHLLSWFEAATQIAHGTLHPHWAFTPAFNAGEPRFVFYPPISWYMGALQGLLLTHLPGVTEAAGWTATPILFTWIALTVCGLTMHRLARAFASRNAALLAAVVYVANPYMLFTAYERTAYAELLAAAWIPLLLLAILRQRVTIPSIALPLALLWLTNAPAAVMGTYTLALLAIVRIVASARATGDADAVTGTSRQRTSLELSVAAFAGTALGFALAAFYIVPAAYERRFVQVSMATIAGMRIDQNFLFERTGVSPDDLLHDQVLRTASVIAVLLLAATAAALWAARGAAKPGASHVEPQTPDSRGICFPMLPLGVLTGSIAILLTPLSAPIWAHAPEAAFLQFPWRLMAILAPVFCLALARALTIREREGFTARLTTVAAFVALTLAAYHAFRQPCDPEDTAPARLALFHSGLGTDPTDEYTPTTADNDALQPNNPPYWLADTSTANPGAPSLASETRDVPPPSAIPGAAPTHLAIAAAHAETLILNLRDYPAWHVTLNGAASPLHLQRPDGLIAIAIPGGDSTVDIRYATARDQTLGDAVTLAALPIFFVALRRSRGTNS